MFRSKIKKRYRKSRNLRFYQGDLLKEIVFVSGYAEKHLEKTKYTLPYAIIMSQDCDLQSDIRCKEERKNQNNLLSSILICPAFELEKFSAGTHFIDWEMESFDSGKIKKLKCNNEYKRYHYMKADSEYSIPELVIDFKHFFTVPVDFLYYQKKDKYLASLNEIFREELSQRFANFLSRIGLPEID